MSRIPPALTMLPVVLMRSNEFGDAPAQMMALAFGIVYKKGDTQPTIEVATSHPSCHMSPVAKHSSRLLPELNQLPN